MGALTDLAGGKDGRFFKIVPNHVDMKKAPGQSVLPKPTVWKWLSAALTLRHVWASPNTVWSLIALAMYFAVPYDLSPSGSAAVAPLSAAFFRERLPLWLLATFGYTAFFHVTLYWFNWAERPFIPNRVYNPDKVLHNMFWSLCGVIQWVAFENVFAFLWASKRLSFMSDAEAFASPAGIARFIAGLILVPLWRDFHFYFAHRLLHIKSMYVQVHSLHHRNTDIEPFAGLSMHPIEHLYYYACILPSLVCYASPFHFLWNGVHLLLAPGASHSGYEDHFQADAFHYMHHRYFECNYAGLNAAVMDVVFGTFVEKFKEEDGSKAAARMDAKSTLKGAPTLEFVTYLSLCAACLGAWAYTACATAAGAAPVSREVAAALALVAGFGPVLIASAMSQGREGGTPLMKQGALAALMHVGVGSLFCSVPIALACFWSL